MQYDIEKLEISPCTDTALLSMLCREMMEDEPSDAIPADEEIKRRMEAFLAAGDIAYLFTAGGQTAGYALVIAQRSPVYLRHFYISRAHRRKGYGTQAFRLLLQTLGVREMDLDVFVWNARGQAFWQSLGFEPRATIMRYSADGGQ